MNGITEEDKVKSSRWQIWPILHLPPKPESPVLAHYRRLELHKQLATKLHLPQ